MDSPVVRKMDNALWSGVRYCESCERWFDIGGGKWDEARGICTDCDYARQQEADWRSGR